ncbi:hypothetical protein M0G74_15450 [Microbulbifer sp. CAU 1566]|uniref:hypothetical protein n=1 Tax=unclassified Microbulbifer TaxID=2619833 RepID=UPI00135B7F46|nr:MULTISPECIES: hypothetical protein [unclassified Microbulbifer]MCK7598673.1 hypothetical protein [Microbulbifer sp. CAU 1566]
MQLFIFLYTLMYSKLPHLGADVNRKNIGERRGRREEAKVPPGCGDSAGADGDETGEGVDNTG